MTLTGLSDTINACNSCIRFHVHCANLIAASVVFKDMLELGGSSAAKVVELMESSDILEAILPYIYPQRVPDFVLKIPASLAVIQSLHKYSVSPLRIGTRDCFS